MTKPDPGRPGRIVQITAPSNPRIKHIRNLARKRHRDETGTFIAEGFKLVRDAVENGWSVEALIYSHGFASQNPSISEFAAQVRASGSDILEVNDRVLGSITRRDNPQMVIAVIRQKWAELPNTIDDETAIWIALDRVRDPGNLGTIIRTADAAGASGVVLVGETTDPYSMEATRASMGSIFNVPIARVGEDAFAGWAERTGALVVGTHLEGARDYRDIDYRSRPVILLMGNEQQGLPEPLARSCDELALIPMAGTADSLNLAIATGIMLFHMGKRLPLPAGKADKQ